MSRRWQPVRRRTNSHTTARHRRLFLESLEPRRVLATVSWDGGGGNLDWNTAANWSGDIVPGPSDDVVINWGTNDFEVYQDSGSNSIQSLSSQASLRLSGGTFFLATDSTIAGRFTIQNATLAIAGEMTVDGFAEIDANSVLQGANSGGTLLARGGTSFEAHSPIFFQQGFHYRNEVGQAATLVGYWGIWMNDHSVFENAGTLELQESGLGFTSYDLASEFHNTGTVVQNGANSRVIRTGVITNDGTIAVHAGSLQIGNDPGNSTITNTGMIQGDEGSNLTVYGSLMSTGPITADRIAFGNGPASFAGTFAANSPSFSSTPAVFTGTVLQFGNLQILGGTFDVTAATLAPGVTTLDTLTVNNALWLTKDAWAVTGLTQLLSNTQLQSVAGSGSLSALGGTTFEANSPIFLQQGFRYRNEVGQTATFVGYWGIWMNDHSVFENAGTLELQGSGLGFTSYDLASEFHNTGTIVQNGANSRMIRTGVITNDGTIAVHAGSLQIGNDPGNSTITNTGMIQGDAGSNLTVYGSLMSTGPITADRIAFVNGPASFAGTFAANSPSFSSTPAVFTGTVLQFGNLQILGGTFDVTAATLAPGVTTLDTLTVNNALWLTKDAWAVTGLTQLHSNTQLQSVAGSGSLSALGGTTFEANSPIFLQQGFRYRNEVGQTATFVGYWGIWMNDHSVFENAGTLELQGSGLGFTSYDLASEFHNTGTVVQNVANSRMIRTGVITNDGTIAVHAGSLQIGNDPGNSTITNTGMIQGDVGSNLTVYGSLMSTGPITADRIAFGNGPASFAGTFAANSPSFSSTPAVFTGTVLQFGNLQILGGTFDVTAATLAPGVTTLDTLTVNNALWLTKDAWAVTGLTQLLSNTQLQSVAGSGSLSALGGTTFEANSPIFLQQGFRYRNEVGQTATFVGYWGIWMNDHSVFENAGTLELQGSGLGFTSYDLASEFHNTGTIVQNGANSRMIRTGVITNDGTIAVHAGSLQIGNDPGNSTITNTGMIQGDAGSNLTVYGSLMSTGPITADRIAFGNGPASFAGTFAANSPSFSSTPATFTGTVLKFGNLQITGGTVDVTGATLPSSAKALDSLQLMNGQLRTVDNLVVAGEFHWQNGILRGASGSGSLTLLSDSTIDGYLGLEDFHLVNRARMNWTAASIQVSGETSSITNAEDAVFDDRIDGTFGSVDGQCATFQNDGLFVKSGLTGITNLAMQLYNRGTVQVNQGQLFVGCGYVSNTPEPPSDGITYPPELPPEFRPDGGVTLPPSDGDPAPVVVSGGFTQTVSGILVEQIAGHTAPDRYGIPGRDYGQLVVLADVRLAGTLQIELMNGFTPALGQEYLLIDSRGSQPIYGTFRDLPEGAELWVGIYGFQVSYVGGDGNDVVLTMNQLANQAPTADAGGAYTINEGGDLLLNGLGSSDPDHDTLTYAWDVDGDGAFDDASGSTPLVTWSQLVALGLRDGDRTWMIGLVVSDGQHTATSFARVSLLNVAPTVMLSAQPGLAIEAGESVTISSSTYDPAGESDPLTYQWLVTKDGSPFASLSASASYTLSNASAGQYQLFLTVNDDDGGVTTQSLIVVVTPSSRNTAPVVEIHTPEDGFFGVSSKFVFRAFDADLIDRNGLFRYVIAWGDGSTSRVTGGREIVVPHTYSSVSANGAYSISATAQDPRGAISEIAKTEFVVSGWGVLADPINSNQSVLVLVGTQHADRIQVILTANSVWMIQLKSYDVDGEECNSDEDEELRDDDTHGNLVIRNVSPLGISRILVFGFAGDDRITIGDSIVRDAQIWGGTGDDFIRGGGGNDAISGESGNDVLFGGSGRDLLIGGLGADQIHGDAQDDILIGGFVSYERDVPVGFLSNTGPWSVAANRIALESILFEWTSTASYSTRVSRLRGDTPGGRNGNYVLRAEGDRARRTVFDENVADQLWGDQGSDWLLMNRDGENGSKTDRALSLDRGEVIDDTDDWR